MGDVKNKIDQIRHDMENMKTELYAISNSKILSLDSYYRSLYLKMLATIVQYDNVPNDTQILFLKRLQKGMDVDSSVEDYMRQSLDLKKEDLKEFFEYMRTSDIRFYFTIEGIILASLGDIESEGYKYLGEIVELLCVTRKELEYISLVAKAIIEQDAEEYDKSKEIIPESLYGISFVSYVENFYVGKIVDTPKEKCYYAPSIQDKYELEFENDYYFTESIIVFINIVIKVTHDILFTGCECVEFYGCKIYGDKHALRFLGCGNVIFNECQLLGFKSFTIVKGDVNKLELKNSIFKDCIYRHNLSHGIEGCVIHELYKKTSVKGINSPNVIISNCEFNNCGGDNENIFQVPNQIICNDYCEVRNSKFINCHAYDVGNIHDRNSSLFPASCIVNDNEVLGEIKLLDD